MGKKLNILVGIILIVISNNTLKAISPDSDIKNTVSLSNEKILELNTIWFGTTNAAALTFYDFNGQLGKASLNYEHSEGDYKLFQENGSSNVYGFYTDGYIEKGKWKFYGKFNYNNSLSPGTKWVDVMNPYNGNPYTVGDSIGGKYWKEYFIMEGKGAYKLNELVSLGFDINYTTGEGTKRKDPRPVNVTTTFDICPGIVFNLGKIKAGADFKYLTEKEDIEFETVVSDNNYDLFYFRGLGVFSSTFQLDDRFTETELFGGGFQFVYDNQNFKNITSVDFDKKVTDIKRGSSHPLQVVMLDNYFTDMSTTFMFLPSEKEVNKLSFSYNNLKIYGQEPVVEPKLEQTQYQWSTAAKYTLYWNKAQQYMINFSHYKFTDANHIDWGTEISGKINSDKTTYYFVPEFNKQTVNQYTISALVEKGMVLKKSEVLLSVNGVYRNSFDSSLKIVEDENLLSVVNTDFINHDFEYLSAAIWQAGVSLKIGKPVTLDKFPCEVFLNTSYNITISDLPENANWKNFELKLGIIF